MRGSKRHADGIITLKARKLSGCLARLLGKRSANAADAVVSDGTPLAKIIIASTTREWSEVFSAHGRQYAPPQVIFLRPPRHHPSRGFGYTPKFAVLVDLGEMADIKTVFKGNGDALIALVVAHEVAHHVQYINQAFRGTAATSGVAFELETDCAAGWWLASANRRNAALTGRPLYLVPDLERELPRLLQALDLLRQGMTSSRDQDSATDHGPSDQRARAVRYGLSSSAPSICGPGISPATAE